jgi:hypothetical protein
VFLGENGQNSQFWLSPQRSAPAVHKALAHFQLGQPRQLLFLLGRLSGNLATILDRSLRSDFAERVVSFSQECFQLLACMLIERVKQFAVGRVDRLVWHRVFK